MRALVYVHFGSCYAKASAAAHARPGRTPRRRARESVVYWFSFSNPRTRFSPVNTQGSAHLPAGAGACVGTAEA